MAKPRATPHFAIAMAITPYTTSRKRNKTVNHSTQKLLSSGDHFTSCLATTSAAVLDIRGNLTILRPVVGDEATVVKCPDAELTHGVCAGA